MNLRAVIGGIIIGIIVGPLATGAIGSIFWPDAADNNRSQEVAYHLYKLSKIRPPIEAFEATFHLPCNGELRNAAKTMNLAASAPELFFILEKARADFISAKYENRAVSSLESLPAPILGALNGCISSSPVSSLCKKYISNRIDNAFNIAAETQEAWRIAANRQIDRPWCDANTIYRR